MMIIIDISNPFNWKAGKIKSDIGGNGFRVWWLWFALTYAPCSDYEFLQIIASGNTHWIKND